MRKTKKGVKMKKRIEILPYPNGFLVALFFDSDKGARKEADKIRESVTADLLTRGHLPRPNDVECKGGGYCFEVAVKDERPELLDDVKQALSRTPEEGKKR